MSFLKHIVASQISAKDIAICFNLPIGTVAEHNLVVELSFLFMSSDKRYRAFLFVVASISAIINRNKRRGLHKKRVPQDRLGPNMAAILSIVLEPQHGGHDVM